MKNDILILLEIWSMRLKALEELYLSYVVGNREVLKARIECLQTCINEVRRIHNEKKHI